MRRNNLLKILLSAVLAFALWLYVITVVSPGSEKTYYNIPVTFQNENVLAERSLIITEYNESVTLTLEGNRTDLNTMNESNINILANVSDIMAPGIHKISYDINFPGNIADNAVTTTTKSIDMVTVKVENLVTKSVNIEYAANNNLPENYHPQDPVYTVDGEAVTQIQVSGPESAVNKIEYAMIYVDFAGRTESIDAEMEYTLCDTNRQRVDVDPDLISTNVPAVRMDMKIHQYKEVPLKMEVKAGGGATEENCTITITPLEKLTISGEAKILKDLDAIVVGTVDLAQQREDTTLTLPLTMPEGVVNRTGTTAEVQVEVKLSGLKTKILQVSQFRITNKPQGLGYEGLPTSVSVEVRGPAELIDKIQPSDITIIVDLKDMQAGVNPVQAAFEYGKDFTAVGVLSDHELMLTLKAQ